MAADTTRARPPARSAPAGGKAGEKQFLGQPMWLWVVGAVVVVGGFLYLRSHQSQSQGQGQGKGQGGGGGGGGRGGGGGGAQTGWTTESFKTWTRDHHNHPKKK